MRGRGRFVGDIRLPGMKEVAFVRSPLAHAQILGIRVPDRYAASVFDISHLKADGVRAIRAASALPGFKLSDQPALADGKVRFVGEPVAMCVADSRAEAEDIAAAVEVDYRELGVNSNMIAARAPDAPRIHDDWDDNVFLETFVDGDIDSAAADAAITISRTFRTNRQCMSPLEGKGCIAHIDRHVEQLVLTTSTQMPHIVRTGLAECLGIEQRELRVVAPDVGGGFGWKGLLQPEEVCVGWLARRLDRPVRWLEDRREHLIAAANCREHHYDVTVHAGADGRLLAVDAVAHVDAGAYSAYPFSACLEAAQVGSILPGPYDFDAYRCRTYSMCTNKPPIVPYRGVARTGVCFAMELMIDAIAREAGLEPSEVRLRNLVAPEKMPFRNITGKDFDGGDYPQSVRRAVELIGQDAVRARQQQSEDDGRLIGLGLATFTEQGAHGTSVYYGWGIPMVPGTEQAVARLTPDGTLELRIGNQSHGQGMETTMAQIAHEVLGIDPDQVNLIHGDTAMSPYSTGTWGSRSAVMAGGAVAAACDEMAERVTHIGAHLLQTEPGAVRVEGGRVVAEGGSVSFADIAHTWYMQPQNLPDDADPRGLDLVTGFRPKVDTGTFSYATHAVVVAVDPETGGVDLLDYVVVEDGGTMINPMIVDGQVLGGAAQGIGTALYEEMPFDGEGQPLASTLQDYLLPGPVEVPDIRIEHMVTPSPNTRFGVKGVGEGGAIAPPAAIANAVNDALQRYGVEMTESPITPRRIITALAGAGGSGSGS
jgi:carbon-monoxide dehydrogenase large subunit